MDFLLHQRTVVLVLIAHLLIVFGFGSDRSRASVIGEVSSGVVQIVTPFGMDSASAGRLVDVHGSTVWCWVQAVFRHDDELGTTP